MSIDLRPHLGKFSQEESFLLMDIFNDLGTKEYTVEYYVEKYTFRRIRNIFGLLFETDLNLDVMDEINLMFKELLEKYPPNDYPEKWI